MVELMGKLSRTKGKRWERAVVHVLKAWGFRADRTAAMLEAHGGATGVDVRAERGECALAVQCKVGARPNIWQAVTEADGGAGDGLPVAFVRRNRGEGRSQPQTVVAMSVETFRRLVG